MTVGKLDELFQKFEPLFQFCLANPGAQECRCGASGDGSTQECCCGPAMPAEVNAFDHALFRLQSELGEGETLSAHEVAQFVNLRAKEVLSGYDVSYRVGRGGGYLVSYEPRALTIAMPDVVEIEPRRRKKRASFGFRVLELLLPRKEREAALGDLEEECIEIRSTRGALAAHRFVLRQIRRSLWPLVRRVAMRVLYRVLVRAFYAMALGALYWIIEHLTGRSVH